MKPLLEYAISFFVSLGIGALLALAWYLLERYVDSRIQRGLELHTRKWEKIEFRLNALLTTSEVYIQYLLDQLAGIRDR